MTTDIICFPCSKRGRLMDWLCFQSSRPSYVEGKRKTRRQGWPFKGDRDLFLALIVIGLGCSTPFDGPPTLACPSSEWRPDDLAASSVNQSLGRTPKGVNWEASQMGRRERQVKMRLTIFLIDFDSLALPICSLRLLSKQRSFRIPQLFAYHSQIYLKAFSVNGYRKCQGFNEKLPRWSDRIQQQYRTIIRFWNAHLQ